MNKQKWFKSSVALLLSSLIVTSGATVFTASAAETNTAKTEDNPPSDATEAVSEPTAASEENISGLIEDEELHATGDLGLSDEAKASLEVIASLDDYKKTLREENSSSELLSNSSAAVSLPSSVDNSTSKYFPEIDSQGSVGSCCAWASIYYQMSYTVNKMLDREATRENTLSPLWIYTCGNNGNPKTGMAAEDPFKIAQTTGVATLRTSPTIYDGVSWKRTKSAGEEAQKYKVDKVKILEIGSATIDNPHSESLEVLKTALAEGDILTMSTYAYGWKYGTIFSDSRVPANRKYEGQYIIPYLRSTEGGHRVTIVGYDDDIWFDINEDGKVQEAEKGAFKIANSWGIGEANKGFIWMSYDALNAKSALGTMSNVLRADSSAMKDIIRISTKPLEAASGINLEFSMESQSRYDNKVTITATDSNGKVFTCKPDPFKSQSQSYGDAFELDKTVFVYDLNTVVPEITSETLANYQWSVKFEDIASNGKSTTISDVKIVDTNLDTEYRCKDGSKTIEKKSDTPSFEASIDASASNGVSLLGYTGGDTPTASQTVIYYKGYSTPYIHYQVGSGSWTNAPGYAMTATSEKSGYTHKYTIELGSQSYANVCFNDGKGNWDSRNGANYRFEKGTYTYSNGTMTKIDNPSPSDAFKVNYFHSNDVENVLYTNQSLELSAKAENNGSSYTYCFGYIKNGKEVLGNYSSNSSAAFDIKEQTTVTPVVYIKDNKGNTVKKTGKTISVKNAFELTTFQSNSSSNLSVGSDYSVKMGLTSCVDPKQSVNVVALMFRNNNFDQFGSYDVNGVYENTKAFEINEPGYYEVIYYTYDFDDRRILWKDSFYAGAVGSKCEVYYNGSSTTKMYYSTDDGKTFKSVSMSKNTKYKSAQYYASIGSLSGSAKVYFVDANNNKDDNNGSYYVLTNGKYLFNYGSFYAIKNDSDPVKIKETDITLYRKNAKGENEVDETGKFQSNGSIFVQADLNSEDAFEGRLWEFGYTTQDGRKFVDAKYYSSSWYEYRTMNITECASVKPYITVTDIYGNTDTKVFDDIKVHNAVIKKFDVTPSGKAYVGNRVQLYTEFTYASSSCKVKYEIKKNNKVYFTDTKEAKNNRTSWTVTEAGTYTVSVAVISDYGTEEEAQETLTVVSLDEFKIKSFTTASRSEIIYPEHVKVTVSIEGGKAPYQYQFGYLKDGKSMYYSTQTDNATSMDWDFVFSEVGAKYTPIVYVTDAAGKTANKQLNPIMVYEGLSITKFKATPNSSVKVNTAVTFDVAVQNAELKDGKLSSAVITINKGDTKVTELDYRAGENVWTPTAAGTYTAKLKVTDANFVSRESTLTITVEEDNPVTENEVTIYYKGYSSPYIHYQVDGGSWTNAPGYAMTATTEQSGYTPVSYTHLTLPTNREV